jgi:hypothetical protein
LVAVRAVHLEDLFTVRSEQHHRHIDPALLYHCVQVLPRRERDLVRMTLASGQFAFDGFARLNPAYIFFRLSLSARGGLRK